jgi:acyl-CoA synthetase (AMP-forming)/AMP-acid ligase II
MTVFGQGKDNGGGSTVVSLLGVRAEEQPDAIAYSFVSDSGERRITYAELDRQARLVGCLLTERRLKGATALLMYPPGIDYIVAFFGCLYAGVIAVPAYPTPPGTARLDHSQCRLAAIARDAMPTVALVPDATGSVLLALSRVISEPSRMRVISTGDLPQDQGWQPATAAPESIALLQYTSGATSAPKGVALTHRNLISNSEWIFRCFGHSSQSRGVIWLPPHHDMGLVGGIIQPMYGGFPVTLMAQADFLRRPLSWLEEISRTQATTSGGPDFAYDLCVRKTTEQERSRLDLSSWRIAFNGSEPVHAETMERFARAFEPSGFRPEAFHPCYGLAEGTLLVTGGRPWSRGGTRSFDVAALRRGRAIPATADAGSRRVISAGSAAGGHRVLIVDPATGSERAPGEIGEIWLCGESVARSYWRRPEETRMMLGARLADTGEGPFVRSGDLGFMLDDQLYPVGSIKDLIVVDGCAHHAHDVERTAERSSPVLRPGRGAAFVAVDAGLERLVVAYEISRHAGAVNVGDVAGAIRAAVAAEHELRVDTVVLVAPGGIARTSSGKVRRRLCAALFEQGKLAELGRSSVGQAADGGRLHLDRPGLLAVPAEARRDLLREYLCRLVASACEVSETEVADVPLRTLGVDSHAMVRIQQSIEADLGVHLTAPDLAHAAGIEDLAIRLDERLAIVAVPSRPQAPASADERSPWFLREIRPGTVDHSIAIALRLGGELDVRALDRAVDSLMTRLAPLNPVHNRDGVTPALATAGTGQRAWFRDYEAANVDDTELISRLEDAAREPFDLDCGPLLRIHRYRRTRLETVLLVVTHHLIADFWSLTTFVRELEMLHAGQLAGISAPLPELTDSVRHYSWISGSRVPGRAASDAQASRRNITLPSLRGLCPLPGVVAILPARPRPCFPPVPASRSPVCADSGVAAGWKAVRSGRKA